MSSNKLWTYNFDLGCYQTEFSRNNPTTIQSETFTTDIPTSFLNIKQEVAENLKFLTKFLCRPLRFRQLEYLVENGILENVVMVIASHRSVLAVENRSGMVADVVFAFSKPEPRSKENFIEFVDICHKCSTPVFRLDSMAYSKFFECCDCKMFYRD